MKIAYDNVMVCMDCAMYIANGDLPDYNPDNWSAADLERNWRGYNLYVGDTEKDDEFSWSQCDGCGSRLGGSRFHCVALED